MSSPTLNQLMAEMVHQDEMESEASQELWTWLPSYKEAEKHHGDYASEFRPSVGDIMKEATFFISHNLNPTEEQIKEAGEFYQCPCDREH